MSPPSALSENAIGWRLLLVAGGIYAVAAVVVALGHRRAGKRDPHVGLRFALEVGLVGWPLVLSWAGAWWFFGMVFFTTVASAREMFSALSKSPLGAYPTWGTALAVLLLPGAIAFRLDLAPTALALALGLGLILALFVRRRVAAPNLSTRVLGTAVGVVFPSMFLASSARLELLGNRFGDVVFVYGVVEIADSFAYLFGRFFGERPAFPKLSPNKTRGGVVGGLLAAPLGGALLSFAVPGVDFRLGALAGAGLGLLGLAGDLVGSAVKRAACLKDYGALVPTHGGVLDVYDSFIFAMPFWVVYLDIARSG